jgi:hypothetical protein
MKIQIKPYQKVGEVKKVGIVLKIKVGVVLKIKVGVVLKIKVGVVLKIKVVDNLVMI